jgi:hypothetical protein
MRFRIARLDHSTNPPPNVTDFIPPQSNNFIIFRDSPISEVIRIDDQGFYYRGELIEDAGMAHRLMITYLQRHTSMHPEVVERLESQAEAKGAAADETDEHYEWELQDSSGEWVAGGSANDQSAVRQEGMHYLTVYSRDGPHKLIIRRHQVRTVTEMEMGEVIPASEGG